MQTPWRAPTLRDRLRNLLLRGGVEDLISDLLATSAAGTEEEWDRIGSPWLPLVDGLAAGAFADLEEAAAGTASTAGRRRGRLKEVCHALGD